MNSGFCWAVSPFENNSGRVLPFVEPKTSDDKSRRNRKDSNCQSQPDSLVGR